MPHPNILAPPDGLGAAGPVPKLADKLQLFGQFVGRWDITVTNYRPDGSEQRFEGEWNFGWVLDGRAVQDVWIVPSRAELARTGDPLFEYGTTIRFYDPSIDAWRATYMGPVRSIDVHLIGRKIGDEIVNEFTSPDGAHYRWIFSQITPTSFHWRSIWSKDNWKSSRLDQEFSASRHESKREGSL